MFAAGDSRIAPKGIIRDLRRREREKELRRKDERAREGFGGRGHLDYIGEGFGFWNKATTQRCNYEKGLVFLRISQ